MSWPGHVDASLTGWGVVLHEFDCAIAEGDRVASENGQGQHERDAGLI